MTRNIDSEQAPPGTPRAEAVLIVGGAAATAEADRRQRELVQRGGTVLSGAWRPSFVRPLGGLIEVIEEAAARVQDDEPELLQRYGWSLVNLFLPWRRSRAALPVGELRAGLADLVLRGDQTLVHQFFQKRNVRPQVVSYLVHFVVESAAALARDRKAPVVLRLDGVHLADEQAVGALLQIARYARTRRVPLTTLAVAGLVAGTEAAALGRESGEWRVIEAPPAEAPRPPETALAQALAVATAFALPVRREGLLAELGGGAEAVSLVDTLIEAGWLVSAAEGRWRPAPGADAAAGVLAGDRWRLLHRRLLAGEEGEDPFAAAWHVAEGEVADQLRPRWLAAMERAWAVSAYETAIACAERAIASPPPDDDSLDADLLRAVLLYEAERYAEADRAFAAALARPRSDADRNFIEYLAGYNCVFGTGDYPRGIEILGRVLRHYEAIGDRRGAAYIRNSMAFAHVRSRNVGEAIDLERLNLEQLEGSGVQDSFLLSILQLNLGRIYRNTGQAEHALVLFRQGLSVERAEPSSHVLLLFYATLGGLELAAGDPAKALGTYHHAFELVRDMQLDSVKDQVVDAFSKGVPELPPRRVTRADRMRYYLHFHLASTCYALGLTERAEVYSDALFERANLYGESAVRAMREAFGEAAGRIAAADGLGPVPVFARETDDLLAASPGLLRVEAGDEETAAAAAEALTAGRSVALVLSRDVGAGAVVVDCVLLYDPRDLSSAERLTEEFGGSHIPRATSAMALPEAVDLFYDLFPTPLVQQSATLRREQRARLAALLPVQIAVQVLSPRFDGPICEVVRGFAARTGVPIVAAIPFHLWRRDLADTPRRAVATFLVGSADALVLGDRLLVKAHGSASVENLRDFRPRLSEEALVFGGRPGREEPSLLIRIKRRGGYATDDLLRLNPATRPLLDLCDGRRTVAEIARLADPGHDQGLARIGGFLRELWRRGALSLDEPAAGPPAVRQAG